MRRHTCRTSSSHVQIRITLTVCQQVAVQKSVFLSSGFHHNTTCAITKDRTCSTIFIVCHRRHKVTSADNDSLVSSSAYKTGTNFHCIKETSTSSLHVEAEAVLKIKISDNKRSCRREMIIRRCSRSNNSFDTVWIYLSFVKQFLNRLGHHKRSTYTLLRLENMARLHAYTLHYPFIRGVYNSRHFIVVQNIARNESTDSCNYSVNFFHRYSNTIKKKPEKTYFRILWL